MNKRIAYAATAGLALLLAAAAPDTTPADQSAVMARIDADHDGTISLLEAKTAAATKFDALDTDREGTLDKSELTGILAPSAVTRADRDRDGTLDKAEFLSLVEKLFATADRDHDSTLSPAELSTEEGRALVSLLAY